MANESCQKPEQRLVCLVSGCPEVVLRGVVVLERVTLLVLEEDAGNAPYGERIMVAVRSQFPSVQ